jgi:hypothetical protein
MHLHIEIRVMLRLRPDRKYQQGSTLLMRPAAALVYDNRNPSTSSRIRRAISSPMAPDDFIMNRRFRADAATCPVFV